MIAPKPIPHTRDVNRQPKEPAIPVITGMNMADPTEKEAAIIPPRMPAFLLNHLRAVACKGTKWVMLTGNAIRMP